MKTPKTKRTPKPTPIVRVALKKKKCIAAAVGHRRCNCGSQDCGPNIVTD